MNAPQFKLAVESVPFGKRLPTALYLSRPANGDRVGTELWATICRAETAARPDPTWNLLKLHLDQFALTFLSYPDFDTEPHPSLAEATKINLNSGAIVRTDYRTRSNPPILHRKEAFLPPTDPRIPEYAALTQREEEAGLYRDPSRIGLRVHWLTLLKRLGLAYEGHTLISIESRAERDRLPQAARRVRSAERINAESEILPIDRHRTAIKRYDLSKPVKQLLERGLLEKE